MSSTILLAIMAALIAIGWLLIDTVGIWMLAAAAIFAGALLIKIIRGRRAGK